MLRRTLALLLAALTALAIAACAPTSDDVPEERHAVSILTGTTNINLNYEAFRALLAERHPEIELEVTSYHGRNTGEVMRLSLLHGDIPDIYNSTDFWDPATQAEHLLDLSDCGFLGSYTNVALDNVDVNGALYLIPGTYKIGGIYYNATMFAEHGWALPGSFEELEALTAEIRAAGIVPCRAQLEGYSAYPYYAFRSIGSTFFFNTPEGKHWADEHFAGRIASSEPLRPALELMADYARIGMLPTADVRTDEAVDAFKAGRCAMLIMHGYADFNVTAPDGTTYQMGIMPWLAREGQGHNMLLMNISRYYGINRALADPGNEQKLADALTVLELLVSPEGQTALTSGSANALMPLKSSTIVNDSVYLPFSDMLVRGYVISTSIAGRENRILPISEALQDFIAGEFDIDDVINALDTITRKLAADPSAYDIATCTEWLTVEQAAELCCAAIGDAVDADAALLSLTEYHAGRENPYAVQWGIYPGGITPDTVATFIPRGGNVATLTMTGEALTALVASGFDANRDGDSFPYYLSLRGGAPLDPAATYTVATLVSHVPESLVPRLSVTSLAPRNVITKYISALGVVSGEVVDWT